MAVTILTIGDPHFRASNAPQTEVLTSEVVDIIDERSDFDAVVVLGDTLDRHDRVDLFPLHRAIRFLEGIKEALDRHSKRDAKERKLIVLIGNHDRPNNTTFLTDEHAFTSLKQWDSTVVVDTFTRVVIRGKLFVCVPYVPVGRFGEALKGEWRGATAVFAHQEFRGCKFGATASKIGDVYPLDAPLCISGHIHEYSSPQKNIVYPGTPYCTSWRGKDDHAVMVFIFSDVVESERITLARVPVNITHCFDTKTLVDKIESCSRDQLVASLSGDSVVSSIRVKVTCNSRDEYDVFTSGRANKLLQEAGVQVVPVIASSASPVHARRSATRPFSECIIEDLDTRDGLLCDFVKSAFPQALKIHTALSS